MQTCLSWVPMSTTTVDVLHSTYNATQAANFCRRKERKMFFKVCTFNIACWSVSFCFFFSLLLLLFSLFASICIYVYFYACVYFFGCLYEWKYAFCFLVLLFLWYSSSGVSHEQLVNHRLCDFFLPSFWFFWRCPV